MAGYSANKAPATRPRRIAPSYVRYLTKEEKVEINAIALGTEAVQTYIKGEYAVDYHLVVISSSGGIAFSIEYDTVRKGIPAYQYKEAEEKSMTIYPAVVIKSDSWMVSIAIVEYNSAEELARDSIEMPVGMFMDMEVYLLSDFDEIMKE
jgi:hypothetical protein